MCGIVGVFHFDPRRPVDRELFIQQNDSLFHRGPDGGDVFVEDGVALGHRRLAIIDVGGGHQPMWDVEGRIGIVFNGEVYNYRELKQELMSHGHLFRTESDTEVIINGYRQWGERCLDRFVGMFAFALYDRVHRTLFLARDRIGKKPLYIYQDADRLMFASEMKAILADPSVARTMDPTAAADYFAYGYVPAPRTVLRGIRKLEAGHAILVEDGKVKEQRYWDLDFSQVVEGRSLEESSTRLLELLDDAVRLRLRSDVPLGAFLSGGIDSSLIVGLMAHHLPQSVKTHTIGFSEDGYDERAYAKETAVHFRTEHTEKLVTVDALRVIDRLFWHYDEPFADSSAVPTYYLSQATREKVTVALSGDGGDENFAGYRRYRFAMYEDRVRRLLPQTVRHRVVRPVAKLYPKGDFLPQFLRAKATLTNVGETHERAYFLSLTQKTQGRALARDFLAGLGGYDPYIHFERHLGNCTSKDPLARLQYLDFKMYLAEDILTKVDRASMAHSLEVRVPLLDHRIVELAAAMPAKYKLDGGASKIALKRAAAKILPESTLKREKKGFTIPLPEWFRGGLRERAEAIFFDRPGGASGLLDTRGLRRLWYEHQLGISNHATLFWSLLMFEGWADRFLRRPIASEPARPAPHMPEIRTE